MPTIEARVREIIAEQLGFKIEDINNETILADDLGADSLDLVELTMAIEEEFNGEIPDDEAEKMKTVGDVIKYVEAKITEAEKNHFGGWKK